MEFLLFMALFTAVVAYPVWGSYFGEAKGDHVNGVNAMIYVQDHDYWIDDQKKKRNIEIRKALA